jgi:putative transposase
MELTLQVRLLPTTEQAAQLKATLERFNEACNWLGERAFHDRIANKLELQRRYYYELRERFGLSAQMAVRCLARVAGSYKRDRAIQPTFRPHAAMPYDQRLMTFKGLDTVSLLTLEGRLLVAMVMGAYQRQRFDQFEPRQSHMVLRKDGTCLLLVTVQVPDGTPTQPRDILGVDLGIANIAVTSDGDIMTGDAVESVRSRMSRRRRALQKAATAQQASGKRPKGVRRAQKRLRDREARFRRDVNHCISKHLVRLAKDTERGMALEDLQGIRERTRLRKRQRARHHSWGFHQLRSFLQYKAHLAGVSVVVVHPQHTSQSCSACGHVAKGNRKDQETFRCQLCGYSLHADLNAARNIRARALVNAPIVAAS